MNKHREMIFELIYFIYKKFWIFVLIGVAGYLNRGTIADLWSYVPSQTKNNVEQSRIREEISKSEELYQRATAQFSDVNLDGTLSLLKHASELDPENTKIRDHYVELLIKNRDFDIAFEYVGICGYEKCKGLLLSLLENVQDSTIKNGFEMKNLPVLLESYYGLSVYADRPYADIDSGINDPLCNKTNVIINLWRGTYSFSSDEDKKSFSAWIDNHNPERYESNQVKYFFDNDQKKNEFLSWLKVQYADINDVKKKIDKSSKMTNVNSVLFSVRNNGVSIANGFKEHINNDIDHDKCIALNLAQVDSTYFTVAYEGMLKLPNEEYLEFDTMDRAKLTNYGVHVDNVFKYYLYKTLHENCVQAGRC